MLSNRDDLNRALNLDLSEEQWAAVGSDLVPAVIVAGAGSGKTTSMAARVAWLVGSGQVIPERILGLTFTKKATGELLERIRDGLAQLPERPEVSVDPVVQTYHAFAAHIVREHGIRLGREPSAQMLNEASRASLAYRLVCTSALPIADFADAPKTVVKNLLQLDDSLVELDITTEQLRQFDRQLIDELLQAEKILKDTHGMIATARSRILLSELVDEWRTFKARHDVMDFSDQIRLALDIVREFPAIAEHIRQHTDAVMLDEYQDTSLAQHHLLFEIFGAGHPVTAVGDPCQAIYGWRGASVANIERFPHHYGASAPTNRYSLSVNRRSGHRILSMANIIAEPLRVEHHGVEVLAPLESRGSGQVRCALVETQADEIEWIVNDIAAYGEASGQAWGDVAILASTNKDVLACDRALRARGIPTQVFGAASLLAQPVVMDLRAYLEVLSDVTANPWLIHVLTNARWAIGPRDLAALGDRGRHLAEQAGHIKAANVEEALDHAVTESEPVETIALIEALGDLGDPSNYSEQAYERMSELHRHILMLRRHVTDSVPELIQTILDISGLGVEVQITHDNPLQSADQQRALRSFVNLARESSVDSYSSLGGFLSFLHEAERLDIAIPGEQFRHEHAVQILSMHKAKGLQFRRVYVPFMSENSFPNGNKPRSWLTSPAMVPWDLREDCPDELRGFPDRVAGPRTNDFKAYKAALGRLQDLENRRLAYVAITRAEQSLTMTGHWWGHDQTNVRGPHQVLREFHDACVDGLGDIHEWATAEEISPTNPSEQFDPQLVPWPSMNGQQVLAQQQAMVKGSTPGQHRTTQVESWWQAAELLLAEQRAMRSDIRTVRLPDAISGTVWIRSLTHPEQVAAELARPMPQRPSRAAQRGSELHAYIEHRFGQQTLLDPFDLPGAADHDIESDARLLELQQAFEESEFAQRHPVATERPFAVMLDGRVIRGRIDAVFHDHGRYQVIDWKTGSHVEPMQLALYRAAWAMMAGVNQVDVDVAFFLIGPNELITPPDVPVLDVHLLSQP
jgi:DNA helicase II / ATP-dependent DNA helicase PcrA